MMNDSGSADPIGMAPELDAATLEKLDDLAVRFARRLAGAWSHQRLPPTPLARALLALGASLLHAEGGPEAVLDAIDQLGAQAADIRDRPRVLS